MPTDELDVADVEGALRMLRADRHAPDGWHADQRARLLTYIDTGRVTSTRSSTPTSERTVVDVRAVPPPRHRPRVVAVLGLAAVAVLLVVGFVTAPLWERAEAPAAPRVRGRSVPTVPDAVSSRPAPDLFPALAADHPMASAAVADVRRSPVFSGRQVWAVVGRVMGDDLTDVVTVRAAIAEADEMLLGAATVDEVDVAGRPARLAQFDGSSSLVWRDGEVTMVVAGRDPLGFVARAGRVPSAMVGADGTPRLDLASLPPGHQIVAGPETAVSFAVEARLAVPESGAEDDVMVAVTTPDDPFRSATAILEPIDPEALDRVEIGGLVGWAGAPGGEAIVVWEISATTWAVVQHATDVDAALTYARSLEFVDRSTWAARYGVTDLDPLPPPGADRSDCPVDGRSQASFDRRISITCGTIDGVEVSMPVVVGPQLVGMVTETSSTTSVVTLLSDPQGSVPVDLPGIEADAVVRGSGADDPPVMIVSDLGAAAAVLPGALITSRGIVVGRVGEPADEPGAFRVDAAPELHSDAGTVTVVHDPVPVEARA